VISYRVMLNTILDLTLRPSKELSYVISCMITTRVLDTVDMNGTSSSLENVYSPLIYLALYTNATDKQNFYE
jgi:hypothetical protein